MATLFRQLKGVFRRSVIVHEMAVVETIDPVGDIEITVVMGDCNHGLAAAFSSGSSSL